MTAHVLSERGGSFCVLEGIWLLLTVMITSCSRRGEGLPHPAHPIQREAPLQPEPESPGAGGRPSLPGEQQWHHQHQRLPLHRRLTAPAMELWRQSCIRSGQGQNFCGKARAVKKAETIPANTMTRPRQWQSLCVWTVSCSFFSLLTFCSTTVKF